MLLEKEVELERKQVLEVQIGVSRESRSVTVESVAMTEEELSLNEHALEDWQIRWQAFTHRAAEPALSAGSTARADLAN
ncbi:MAG: hypothetical protein CM1200mP41_25930 [Gammaproteobacteria bacterium]|nr:MAG: hypothetical protein CM1200mP41_25930 [Gammaproteobacteria bacterium]